MVFDALGIDGGDFGIHADREKEPVHDVVAYPALIGKAPALWRELDGLVGFGRDQALPLEPLDGLDDGHMRYAELVREITHSADAAHLDQVADRFDIIFSEFGSVIFSSALVCSGIGGI